MHNGSVNAGSPVAQLLCTIGPDRTPGFAIKKYLLRCSIRLYAGGSVTDEIHMEAL
jgi:hypothetical protein